MGAGFLAEEGAPMSGAKLYDGFEKVLEFITIALVIALAGIVILGVTFRVAGNSLAWYDEVAAVMLAWVTYYGAALAALKRAHISFPGLLYAQPPKVRVALVVLGELCILTFFVLLAWYGVVVLQLLGGSTLVSVPIPIRVTQSAIPIGAALYVVAELLTLPDALRQARYGRDASPEEAAGEALR